MSRYADLRNKEIINVEDGRRLGFVCDIEFDMDSGTVSALIVPHKIGFFSFFKKNDEYIIPWDNIKKIGDDIIIVEICL